jgi:hypothetical protein
VKSARVHEVCVCVCLRLILNIDQESSEVNVRIRLEKPEVIYMTLTNIWDVADTA